MSGRSRAHARMGMTRLQYLCMIFGQKCFYCDEDFELVQLTRDHVVPRCEGGSEDLANQVPACQACNQRKGRRMPTDDEIVRIRAVWASSVTKRIKKRHAPPCYVCHGNVAVLPIDVCPECGRLPNGKHIVIRNHQELSA